MPKQRPARTTVQHGMPSCSRYGCKRPECRRAYTRNRKKQRLDLQRGITRFVSAEPAAIHCRRLVERGMPPNEIAARGNLSSTTVTQLIAGRCKRIYRNTETALLAIAVPKGLYQPFADGLMDATGARRRLQALTAIGMPLPVLTRETGLSGETISGLRSGRRAGIRISHNAAITAAYERLWNADPIAVGASPAAPVRARTHARKHGWAPPAAWDDETIGDPKAKPHGVLRPATAAA